MISMIVFFLIFCAMTVFVIQPLFLEQIPEIAETDNYPAALKQRKKILYRQIKELDLDYNLGNIQDEDYHLTRAELKKEVSEILTQLRK